MTTSQLQAKRTALNTHIRMCETSAAQCLANGDRAGWQFYAEEAFDAATLRDDVVAAIDASCQTCNGSGSYYYPGNKCVDCGGTGLRHGVCDTPQCWCSRKVAE